MENKAVIFKREPSGLPRKGEDLAVEAVPYPEALPEGGIIVQNLYGSLDPYLRGRMGKSILTVFLSKEKTSLR